MFEFEQSDAITDSQHPRMLDEHLALFGAGRIASFATVSWGEHCTECAFPTCYTTCSFYQPREDGRCRRFEHGVYRVDQPATWLPYSAFLQFRNWSMLWAQGNATQLPKALGWAIHQFGSAVWFIANPIDAILRRMFGRRKLSLVLQSLRRRFVRLLGRLYALFPAPDAFLLELYNPEPQPMKVRLWMKGSTGAPAPRFEWGTEVQPGFLSCRIPMDEIARVLDCSKPFEMGFTVQDESGKRLYVCSAHFVRFRHIKDNPEEPSNGKASRRVKCVVWDLDHTLWEGVLVESDPSQPYPPLRDGVKSVLQELDKRGILLSVASKNTLEEAQHALEHHGLWSLFVVPQINWNRKSESVGAIARELNIGLDTLAFVDDQSFERDEVQSMVRSVRTYDAAAMLELLGKPEFSGDRNTSGPTRRTYYQTEKKREDDRHLAGGDYDAFLASCGITAKAWSPASELLPRIQDIVERTNQLNTSTTRYDASQLQALLASPRHDCFLIECADRYGSYGYAGFLVVERAGDQATLTDCMFSCRVQGKRIDEAVVRRLVNDYSAAGFGRFVVCYKRSERNAPAAQMLGNAGFASPSEDEAILAVAQPLPLEEIPFVQLEMPPIAPVSNT